GEKNRAERGHSRRERGRVLGALQLGERLLESVGGRVEQALVDETPLRRVAGHETVERARGRVEVGRGIGGTQVDGRRVNAEIGEVAAARVHRARGEALLHGWLQVLFHIVIWMAPSSVSYRYMDGSKFCFMSLYWCYPPIKSIYDE